MEVRFVAQAVELTSKMSNETKDSRHILHDFGIDTAQICEVEAPHFAAFHQASKNSATRRLYPVSRLALAFK